MLYSDNMNFLFAVLLLFRISEFRHRGERTSKTDGGKAMALYDGRASNCLPIGSLISRKMAGTLAISVEMTNFEGKKC